MARHKKHPEHENLERWLVSYADFITLLFATFTALYAIATAKLTDDNKAAESISDGFQAQQETLLKGIASVFAGQGTPSANPNPVFEETGRGEGVIGQYDSLTPNEVEAIEATLEELDEVANELQEKLKEALGENAGDGAQDSVARGLQPEAGELEGVPLRGLEVAMQERGLRISFDSRLLFTSGSAQLDGRTIGFLDSVADRLQKLLGTHLVHVEGHTDNAPINGRYPSNWELSTARASTVVRYLIHKHKFAPIDMAAVGYADSRPIEPNSSPQNQAKNRRIDIILHSRAQEKASEPRTQQRNERVMIDNTRRFTREDNSTIGKDPKNAKNQAQHPTPKGTKETGHDPKAPPVETVPEIHLPIFNPDGSAKQAVPNTPVGSPTPTLPIKEREQTHKASTPAPVALREQAIVRPVQPVQPVFMGATPAIKTLKPTTRRKEDTLLKSEGEF